MLNRYVFYLDNTLINTDLLNSDFYNYALSQKGLLSIKNYVRYRKFVWIMWMHVRPTNNLWRQSWFNKKTAAKWQFFCCLKQNNHKIIKDML